MLTVSVSCTILFSYARYKKVGINQVDLQNMTCRQKFRNNWVIIHTTILSYGTYFYIKEVLFWYNIFQRMSAFSIIFYKSFRGSLHSFNLSSYTVPVKNIFLHFIDKFESLAYQHLLNERTVVCFFKTVKHFHLYHFKIWISINISFQLCPLRYM